MAEEIVLPAPGINPIKTSIGKRQATVSEWVDLRPIFEVCAKETGYEGGGRLWEPWRIQAAAEQQLKATLKDIFSAAWEKRRREFDRHDRGDIGEEEPNSGSDG